MKRKLSLLTCVLLTLALLLSACNGGTQPSSSPSASTDAQQTGDAQVDSQTDEQPVDELPGAEDGDDDVDVDDDDDVDVDDVDIDSEGSEDTDENELELHGGDLLSGVYFDMFNSDQYFIVTMVVAEGFEMRMENYFKDGMVASYVESEGDVIRMILREEKLIFIDDAEETVTIMSGMPEVALDTAVGETEGMEYVGSGSGEFSSRVLLFDQYSDGAGTVMQFFMDRDELVGIRTTIDGFSVDIVILDIGDDVPDSAFEYPDSYTVMEY